MLKSYLKKEIARAKDMIGSYKGDMSAIKKDIKAVDEKYKKLAEEEKKELNATLLEYENQKTYWEDRLASLTSKDTLSDSDTQTAVAATVVDDVTVPETTGEGAEQVAESDDKVVDLLFPDNNDTASTPTEEVVTEANIPEDLGPEVDGAGFTDADNVPPTVEDASLTSFLNGDTAVVAEANQAEDNFFDPNAFPDIPENF